MYPDLVDAKYIEGYKIALTFEDGKNGVVDFKGYISLGGVYGRFIDMEYFKKFHVDKELGVLCWPDDVDIAPETLYHDATGAPLPKWMTGAKGQQEAI